MTKRHNALVSGASSGIGLAVSRLLLDKGYSVTGISRRADSAFLADHNFKTICLDLSNLEKTDECISSILKSADFDCFIHAAGSGQFGSIEQFSVKQLDTAIRTNLTSALVLSRRLVPYFRHRKSGRMIFVGSESALNAGKKGVLYSAAKFGIRGLCQSLREDCAADGLNISLINPGMVRSPFFDQLPFQPAANPENAIHVDDVALLIWQILTSSSDINFDEVNITPRIKSIDFKSRENTSR